MLNRVLKEKIYCGLDIGSQKLKVGLVRVKDDKSEILGAWEQPVYGFKDASVSNLNEFSECINHILQDLSEKTGIKTKEIQIGLDGSLIDIRQTSTAIPLVDKGNKVIASRDVQKLNKQARLLGIKMEEEVLHEMPQIYEVDDVNASTNPLGLYGRKLAVQSLMIVSNLDRIKNILKSVNHAGYDVSNLSFGSYVSSDLVLSEEQRKQGCVLIDIGSKVTSVLIFHDGLLKYIENLPIGGDDFTRDIARELKLSFDLAEEIKKSYGTVLKSHIQQDEEILVKRENAYYPIKKVQIYQAIESQISVLVDGIYESIMKSNLYEYINQGVKMIGGGALLHGLIECVEEKTQLTVSLGQINNVSHKNISNAAVYSTAVSLAQKGFKDSLRYTMSKSGSDKWSSRVISKVKEMYLEYF